jgi:chromosome segregation ATPase
MDEARKTAAEAAEAARKEKAALAEELRQLEAAKAGVQRELETAKTDLQQARHAQAELTADLDKMRAAGSAARAEWEQRMQAAASETRLASGRLDEERTARSAAASEVADLRRQLSASRTERDQLVQQRDDLLRRLSRLTDEHRSFLDELSSPVVAAVPEKPARPSTPTPTVIEVEPEVFTQPEPEKAVNLPRIRPVPIQPPKVGNM